MINNDATVINAGGIFVQLLPDATGEVIEKLEKNIRSLPPVTTLLSEGASLENILERIAGDSSYRLLDKCEVQTECNCSRDRMKRNLISLGRQEISDIAEEQDEAELVCHFCNSVYRFGHQELNEILQGL